MLLKGAACAGLLLVNGLAMAQRVGRPDGVGQRQTPQAGLTEPAGDAGVDQGALRSIRTPRKQPFVNRIPVDHMGRLVIKVIDAADARALPDGSLISLTDRDINDVQAIIQRHGLTMVRAINHSDQALAQLEARAAALSGYVQLRLASIMYVEGDEDALLAALQELKASGNIDWAEWDAKRYPAGGLTGACCLATSCLDGTLQDLCEGILGGNWQGAGTTCLGGECPGACCIDSQGVCLDFIPRSRCETPPPVGFGGEFQGQFVQCADIDCGFIGACCLEDGECEDLTETVCLALPQSFWGGPDLICLSPDLNCDVTCGNTIAGDCFLLDGNGTPFCELEDCCGLVCSIDPFCCDDTTPVPPDPFGEWDDFCAALAHLLCDEPDSDTCTSAINESCFEAHSFPGCNLTPCCNTVCLIDPFCCQQGFTWDDGCVALALVACLANPDADLDPRVPTQVFVPVQGYRTEGRYAAAEIPAELLPFTPLQGGGLGLVTGFGGEGWFLMDQEPFTDANLNGVFDCGESFDDWNGNGVYDHGGEPFVDGETFTDDNGNGSWDLGEPFVDDNPPDGTFNAPNCHYDRGLFQGGAEQFTDQNSNQMYDAGDPYAGVYGLGQQLLEIFGVDATGQGNLALGKTIKTAVIEWGFWGPEPFTDVNGNGQYDAGEPFVDAVPNGIRDPGHEDLDVILEAGQTMIQTAAVTEPDHATACLSIINAKADGRGVTGIAPEAQAYFFPLISVEEGARELTAWTSAMMVLGPGDVISASYGPGPPIGSLNNGAATWAMIRLASDLGITSCIAAGNACFNLDDAPDLGDSGGIVVGACAPGFPYYRLTFSNHCTAPTIARSNIVHVKAWGTNVASAGYGTMYNGNPFDLDGDGLFGEDPIDGDDNDGDGAIDEDPPPLESLSVSRRYRHDFNGTSAAAPQIAGLVADLQGLTKQFFGITVMPEQIRASLCGWLTPSIRSCPPGSPPVNPPRLFGGFLGPGCAFDVDPDLGPHMIGPYPVAAGDFQSAASRLINNFAAFDDAPLVDGINILRGDLIYGNVFSIKASDDNYLVLKGVHTSPLSLPQVPSASGVNPSYLGFGLATDVEVLAHTSSDPLTAGMTVQVETRSEAATTVLMFVDMFDWQRGRWTFIGLAFPFGLETLFEFGVGNPGRFIRKTDDLVLIRVWTLAIGNTGGLTGARGPAHIMRHDLISLDDGGGGGVFFENPF